MQPSIILKSLKQMGENFVENISPHRFLCTKYNEKNNTIENKNEIYFKFDKKITQVFIFIKAVCDVYNDNQKIWKNNSKFQKCLRAINSLYLYCSNFLAFKALYEKNSFFNNENLGKIKIDILLNLYIEYNNIQINLEKHFEKPIHLYACNYTIKDISPYPGFQHKPSVTMSINSKLYSLFLYKNVNKKLFPTVKDFLNNDCHIDNYIPLSISNLLKKNNNENKMNKYWWWDAMYAKDWDLLCFLLPIAKTIECCNDFECLFYTSIQNGANYMVISNFIR
jgi:hypothetical protein